MNPAKPLSGQTILVTGGSRGIGAAIVERLAFEGAWPIIHYGRDKAAAEDVLARIGDRGHVVQADLSTSEGPFALWDEAARTAGRIHALVNNAGIRTNISVDAKADDWKRVWQEEFQVNLFAAADLSKEAILHFQKWGGGRIINMASRAGHRGYMADAMPYGATKAALINLTKSIARGFGADGVTAVAIAPGLVRTDMTEEYIRARGESASVAAVPIGEMTTSVGVAELVAFALRPSQTSLNGATLDVNGGSYMR